MTLSTDQRETGGYTLPRMSKFIEIPANKTNKYLHNLLIINISESILIHLERILYKEITFEKHRFRGRDSCDNAILNTLK